MSLKLLTRLIRINPDYAGCVSSFNDEGLKLLTHERGLAPTDQSEHPSMINHQQTPLSPLYTVWSKLDVTGDIDPLNKGIPRVRGLGITLLGAPIGHQGFVAEALQEKVDKIATITSLLPDLQDPHVEFCLLRSCLALPKMMFLLRTVDTSGHQDILSEFDRHVREALIRILGCPLEDLAWEQAKLPVSMAGLGLRSATDHSAAAYATSFLASQPLVQKLLRTDADADQVPSLLDPGVLATLAARMGEEEEEVTQDSLAGQRQKFVSTKIDLANKNLHLSHMQAETDDEREIARMASLCLPKAGAWLTCAPLPALGLHLRGAEFVVACKFRLGLAVYDQPGPCPNCGKESDIMGDHSMVCGTGGERILRHNAIRDALYNTAVAAGLAPLKEGRALLPGNNRRPADVFVPLWAGGLDAALDVTITHPLQDATRARAATNPGHAMTVAFENKCRVTEDLCREQGITFIPVVAESLGGWHRVALEQLHKLSSALARHTGQEESDMFDHLVKRVSILLQKGLASMLLNRNPSHPDAEIDGQM